MLAVMKLYEHKIKGIIFIREAATVQHIQEAILNMDIVWVSVSNSLKTYNISYIYVYVRTLK